MLRFVTAALVGIGCAIAGAKAAEPTALRVVYTAASDVLPLFVAMEEGLFEKEGLTVTITRTTITPNIVPVLISGEAEIGMSTIPHLLQGAESGLGLTIVSGGSRMVASNPSVSLLARKDTGITKPSDLSGKQIGVPGIMGVVDIVLRTWLSRNSIPVQSVKMVEVPIPLMSDVLKAGTVDAVTAIEPIRTRILETGVGYIAAEFYSDVNPDTIGTFWVSTGQWAANHEDAVSRFRSALDRAIVFIRDNPERASAIEFHYLKLNVPKFPVYSTAVSVDDLQFFEQLLRRSGLLKKDLNLRELIFKL